MSLAQIKQLIRTAPAVLNRGVNEGVEIDGKAIDDAAERILALYQEAKQHTDDLSNADRSKLRARLLHAARRVDDMIKLDEEGGHAPQRLVGSRNVQIFAKIADELGMSLQELQNAISE